MHRGIVFTIAFNFASSVSALQHDRDNLENYGFTGSKSCLADPIKGQVFDPSRFHLGAQPGNTESVILSNHQEGIYRLEGLVTAYVTTGGKPIEWSPQIQRPAPLAKVNIGSANDLLSAFTDYLGRFFQFVSDRSGAADSDYFSTFIRVYSLFDTGTESELLDGNLRGRHRIEVPWQIPDLMPVIHLGTNRAGAVTTETLAAGNTYTHMADEYLWIRSFGELSNFEFYPNFTAVVNIPLMQCNAFYSPEYNRIHMMARIGACPNTAYSSIIRHEGGHAFLFAIGISQPSDFDDFYSLHEGASDAIAALSLDDPCMGEELYGVGSGCARSIENTNYQWSADAEDDAHTEGLAFAGAFWDIHTELKATYGRQIGSEVSKSLLLKTLLLAAEYKTGLNPQLTMRALEADQLLYGGSHQGLIVQSFASHNL